jgi:adenosine deaminase
LKIALFRGICKLIVDYGVDDDEDIEYGEVIVHAERADTSLLKSYAPEETFESQASANPTWWYQLATALIEKKESTGPREV